jgi:hypothetical protein
MTLLAGARHVAACAVATAVFAFVGARPRVLTGEVGNQALTLKRWQVMASTIDNSYRQ